MEGLRNAGSARAASPERGGDWRELARRASASGDAEAQSSAESVVELLACEVAGECYAIPIERVREIVRPRVLTPVPRAPAHLLGVVSLRGEVLQVIDLRRRLGLASGEAGSSSRFVVLRNEDEGIAAVLVDGVRRVLRIDASAIRPSPSADARAVVRICTHEGEFVSILDLEVVLGHAD